MQGIIFDIKRFSVHDGPGIRQTVFFKGCPLNCWWCHNPEGLDIAVEKVETTKYMGDKPFKNTEQVGKLMTVNEVMEEIEKDMVFYDESGGGVTFSGGEPFVQPNFLIALLKECKNINIHTVVDTSGYAPLDTFKDASQHADLFLYDLKIINNPLHIKYTGVDTELILKNLRYLDESNKKYIIRYPLIPGVNDSKSSIEELILFLNTLSTFNGEVSILSFHTIGFNKYNKFNKSNKMNEFHELTADKITQACKQFENAGYTVNIDN